MFSSAHGEKKERMPADISAKCLNLSMDHVDRHLLSGVSLSTARLFFQSQYINPFSSFRNRWGILILHGEGLYWTDLHTEVAGAAFEAVNLPFLAILGDNNGIGRAAPAAHPAEDALMDIVFNSAPGNRGINPLLFRVHERCGSAEQVLSHGFGHRKKFHFVALLPLRAADTGVEGEDDIRDIGHLRTLQYFDHCRNIAEGRHPHPEPLKKF